MSDLTTVEFKHLSLSLCLYLLSGFLFLIKPQDQIIVWNIITPSSDFVRAALQFVERENSAQNHTWKGAMSTNVHAHRNS
jgi:hypothetical protein